MHQLMKDAVVQRIQNAAAAGTSNLTSSAVNMEGFDGALFIYGVGTLTSTQVTSLKLQSSSDNGGSDAYSDITGASTTALADTDGNKLLMVDIFQPQELYLKAVLVRGTANAVVDFGIVIKYKSAKKPVTLDSTVAKAVVAAF